MPVEHRSASKALIGRPDLPPLTTDATGTELSLVDWGEGVLTLRAPDGRYLSVAEDGRVRASAEQPGGWVVQETFRLEPHENGHLLRHIATGHAISVAADGLKVAEGNGEIFEVVVESGEDAVNKVASRADVVLVVAGNDPHISGRETEDRTTLALPAHQERLLRAARTANPNTVLAPVLAYPYAVDHTEVPGARTRGHRLCDRDGAHRAEARDVAPRRRPPRSRSGVVRRAVR